jgi:hypothetical protein
MYKKVIQNFKRDVAATGCDHTEKSLDPSRIQNYNFLEVYQKNNI